MFSKPNTLVYVHRGGVIMFAKHAPQARFSFPDKSVVNMEVLDIRAFTQLCQDFFAAHSARHTRVLVVLDYSVVFEKKIVLDETDDPKAAEDIFLQSIPLEPEQRAVLPVRTKQLWRLFATNADIYLGVRDALIAAGASKVVAAVPVAAYDLGNTKQPLHELTDTLLKDTTVRRSADFTTL